MFATFAKKCVPIRHGRQASSCTPPSTAPALAVRPGAGASAIKLGRLMEVSSDVVRIGVVVGLALGGVFAGALRWSICRNIEQVDKKMDSMINTINDLSATVSQIRQSAITVQECQVCRRECQDRLSANQADILVWLRRQEDKADKMLMMIANLNNGIGGVKNGLK